MAVCARCDSTNPDENAFCGRCGAPLQPDSLNAEPARRDERKLATVLFADVVGFTSLAERTDPEIVAHMVDTAFRELGEAVEAHGGIIDKFMGDSVMAVFGVPVAHDDDAERAVAAALAMRHLGGDLAFSIGVNSGEVMVTAVGRAGDMTVIGDTVNVAARLEKAAGPGQVLCGRLTVELARNRVRFAEHQPVLLKGKREPVEVFVAESIRPSSEGDGENHEQSTTRLVGRDDELEYLVSHWRRTVKERQARVVLLTGDAGSGKSRILHELVAAITAVSPDATIIRATYPAYGVRGGARMAKEIAHQLGPTADSAISARLRSIAGDLDPSLESIPPEAMLQEQLWAFGQFIREKAKKRPLLLVIDDMHHSDERTLEIVSEVVERLADVPVLMVLSGRHEPPEWLRRFTEASSVRLPPLSRTDATELAGDLAGERRLSGEAAEFLAERSNGNPLYLRELVAMAETRGLFFESDDGLCRLAAYEAIPATLHAVLAARLDALPPRAKLTLQHVAVLGERATSERIGELGAAAEPGVLAALTTSGLVVSDGEGCYEIADALLREVAYETLPRNLRGELHRRAAQSAGAGEERARHLERAAEYLSADGDLALQAALALADEGEEMFASSRHRDATTVLERAVELGCRRASALLTLARLLALNGRHGRALEVLALVEDDPDDPTVALERDHTAANSEAFDDPAWAAPRLEESARKWHELGDTAKEGWALANAGVCYFNMSRLRESIELLERSLPLFEEAGDEPGTLAATSFLCLVNPTDPRVPGWLAGALEAADAVGDRARQLSTLTTLTWHHYFRSFLSSVGLGGHELAEAEGFATRLVELAEEVGAFDLAVHGWSLLVVMARTSGRLDLVADRAAEVQRVLGTARHTEAWIGWAASYCAALASGMTGATPPFPPYAATEPVVAMARLIIEMELVFAGRVGESLGHAERPDHSDLGVMSDLLGVVRALGLQLAGRSSDARLAAAEARAAAESLGSPSVAAAADALIAEIDADASVLVGAPDPASLLSRMRGAGEPGQRSAIGIADVLVLRAHLACNTGAVNESDLAEAVAAVRAPGLLLALA